MTLQSDRARQNPGRGHGFPTVFDHDIPLEDDEMGAPIIDRQGKVVGIALSQAQFIGTAVPADCVRRLLPDLIAGRRRNEWKPPAALPAPTPKKGAPVAMGVVELRKHLAERAARYKSVAVEYDVAVESQFEPAQLMRWDIFTIRDYQEGVFTAFSDGKLAGRIKVVGNRPLLAPRETVTADPLAPPAIAKQVEERRQIALTRKDSGDAKRWRAIAEGEETRLVYDGSRCFRWSASAGTGVPFPPDDYQHNCLYLSALGLMPGKPKPTPQQRAAERLSRLPDALDAPSKGRVAPTMAFVGDTPCVLAEFEFSAEGEKGRGEVRVEKIRLDPKRGFAPLEWETWIDGRLRTRRSYADFEEPAPGCWLPGKVVVGVGTPGWVAASFSNKVAFAYVLRVRKLRVNDVPDAVFDPASLRKTPLK
jgi:hypothetical protein